jgi:Phage tail tube protein
MATFLLNQNELAVAQESTYGVEPAAPVGADFFRQTSSHVGIQHVQGAEANDRERNGTTSSVLTQFRGRKSANVSIETDLIPSGNASTPTAPDIDVLLKAIFGSKRTATANSTLTTGSTTTVINLTTGGVAAMGLAVGDLIGVDVSTTYGIEVREVTSITTDAVTVDRALSAAPASGRAVKGAVTYSLDSAEFISVYLWLFGSGTGYRHAVPGLGLNDFTLGISFAQDVPRASLAFTGMGMGEVDHTQTRPTPTLAGSPLAPITGFAWLGASKACLVAANLHVNNGNELRNNESCTLEASGLRRTGNNGRFLAEMSLDMYLRDTNLTTYANGRTLTAIDALVQLGDTGGSMLAWRMRNWQPRSERYEQDTEVGLRLAGRGFGSSGDDEVKLALL